MIHGIMTNGFYRSTFEPKFKVDLVAVGRVIRGVVTPTKKAAEALSAMGIEFPWPVENHKCTLTYRGQEP